MFLTEEFNDDLTDDYLLDFKDYSDTPEKNLRFAVNFYDTLQKLIDEELVDEENTLQEKFTSYNSADRHFQTHCLGYVKKRKSNNYGTGRVYYDFRELDDYLNHEAELVSKIKAADIVIDELTDVQIISQAFNKLLSEECTIVFTTACGFSSTIYSVSLAFHSFANAVTKNFPLDTIDFVVSAPNGKTITMYPISADKVIKLFNRQVERAGLSEYKITETIS